LKLLRLTNLAEEFQTYIAANATGLSLRYVVAENFTIGDVLDMQDLEYLAGSKIDLTLFDEGGNLVPSGSFVQQVRSFRFVTKGDYGQQAITHAQELLQWLWNTKTFKTSHFRIWVARVAKLPSLIARYRSGTNLADFVITTFAYNLV